MPDVHGDRATYDQHVNWTARKATALRRKALDCGHPNPGEVFYHAWCDRLSCSEECANGVHDCSKFAGAKSGTEAEEPVLPPGVMTEAQFLDYLADVVATGEPSQGSGLVSFSRPAHDGSAPADPVADAMRSEVLRQGLTTCEIDGVRQEYRDGGWTVIDETRVFTLDNSSGTFDPTRPTVRMLADGREVFRGRTEPDGPIHASGSFLPLGSRSIGESWARTAGPVAYWPEPVAPPADELVERPDVRDIATRPWRDFADRLLGPLDRPWPRWWHRLFPGRRKR